MPDRNTGSAGMLKNDPLRVLGSDIFWCILQEASIFMLRPATQSQPYSILTYQADSRSEGLILTSFESCQQGLA